ncbi:hypothetical protein HWV62_38224 [Athelia sp. TMB]|nr:hypothetical protein HWV62_38224 [Athelia sp. TMB]
MSARPHRVTRPTERAAAAQKKTDVSEKRSPGKSADMSLLTLASSVTPSAKFVIKSRHAPDERQLSVSMSPPPTPSPVKQRARPTPRPKYKPKCVAYFDYRHSLTIQNRSEILKTVEKVHVEPRDITVEDDDVALYGSPEAEEITDPHFFDDGGSDRIPDDGEENSSEHYWGQVDSVHESDTAFIDDSAAVTDKHQSSRDRASRQSLSVVKGKARHVSVDDLSDYSRRKLVAVRLSTKGNSAAAYVDDSASEEEPAVVDKYEQAELAEAKRRSLAEASYSIRVGSSSNHPRFPQQDNPTDSASVSGIEPPKRQSKLLKVMSGSSAGPFNPSAEKIDKDTVYMDDTTIVGVRGEASPAVCKVKNPEDEDPDIDYTGTCNLDVRHWMSWSDAPHMGLATYSAWPGQCPNINMDQLKLLFEFREFAHIVNPSRATPSTLAAMAIPGRNHVLIKAGSKNTIVQFATILFVTETSQLHSLLALFNENRRTIKGVPQIVEWERMQASLCMAYNIPSANVDMRAGAIVFCTAKTLGTASTSLTSSPVKNPTAFLKKVPAPIGNSSSPFAFAKGTVTGDAIIPILDARGRRFNMEHDLTALDKRLPTFEGEVPEGSCVWVGYTCTKYETQKKGSGLNMNLMWVVVMGTP